MLSTRSQQIDRLMLVLAIVILAVTLGFAVLALRDQIVSNSHAMQAESGGDKSR